MNRFILPQPEHTERVH